MEYVYREMEISTDCEKEERTLTGSIEKHKAEHSGRASWRLWYSEWLKTSYLVILEAI